MYEFAVFHVEIQKRNYANYIIWYMDLWFISLLLRQLDTRGRTVC